MADYIGQRARFEVPLFDSTSYSDIIKFMARGWESKSVESQMDAVEERRASGDKAELSEDQKKIKRERAVLVLARANLLQQMEASTNERYRETIQRTLQDLDEKIAALGK